MQRRVGRGQHDYTAGAPTASVAPEAWMDCEPPIGSPAPHGIILATPSPPWQTIDLTDCMNPDDILLLATKSRVIAVQKADGEIVWSTRLPGSLGESFVTLLAEQDRVYAHTHGQLHCLDLATGDVLWTNELSGMGYGLASLALANGALSPDGPLAQAILDAIERRRHNAQH